MLIDDNSHDGLQDIAASMGVPVLTTGRMTGLTGSMLRAWKYFTSYEGLQTLVIMNNDVMIVPGTFERLHRCSEMAPVPGVTGPMSDYAVSSCRYMVHTTAHTYHMWF